MNPAAMTERLIDAAVYAETATGVYVSGARKEVNEARSAIEIALTAAAPSVKDGALSDALREIERLTAMTKLPVIADYIEVQDNARAAEARASAAEAREAGLRAALELFACDCTGRCEVQQSWPAMAKGCARAQARVLLRARATLSPETQVEP